MRPERSIPRDRIWAWCLCLIGHAVIGGTALHADRQADVLDTLFRCAPRRKPTP